MGTAAAVFEQDQGVDALEVDSVDMEEVDRDDVLCSGCVERFNWAGNGYQLQLARSVGRTTPKSRTTGRTPERVMDWLLAGRAALPWGSDPVAIRTSAS